MAKNGRGTGGRSKRGKPAKKTVDKADTVETRKSGELDVNKIQIPKQDFARHYDKILSAKNAMKSAKSAYDQACKAAKAVSDHMLECCRLKLTLIGKPQDEVANTLKHYGFVLEDIGSPIQLTLHNGLIADTIDTAYKRGFDDGLAGKGQDNRYPVGSDLAERYEIGWVEGQKKLGENGLLRQQQPAQGVPNGTNTGEPLPMQ